MMQQNVNEWNANLDSVQMPPINGEQQLSEIKEIKKSQQQLQHKEQEQAMQGKKQLKPINFEELNQFSKVYEETLKKKQEEHQEKQLSEFLQWKQRMPNIEKKSKAYQQLQKLEMEQKLEQQKKKLQTQECLLRRKQYGKIQFEALRERNLKRHLKLSPIQQKTEANDSQQGQQYEEKEEDQKFQTQSENIHRTPNKIKYQISQKLELKQIDEKLQQENKQRLKKYKEMDERNKREIEDKYDRNSNTAKYKNYLKEIQLPKNEQTKQNQNQQFKRVLEDKKLNEKEKFHYILKNTDELENQAKIKENFAKLGNKKNDIEYQESIDNLYLNSIKAKLQFLEQFKQE